VGCQFLAAAYFCRRQAETLIHAEDLTLSLLACHISRFWLRDPRWKGGRACRSRSAWERRDSRCHLLDDNELEPICGVGNLPIEEQACPQHLHPLGILHTRPPILHGSRSRGFPYFCRPYGVWCVPNIDAQLRYWYTPSIEKHVPVDFQRRLGLRNVFVTRWTITT